MNMYMLVKYKIQWGFPTPATKMMAGIIDLHHTIMINLIFVFCLVIWMLGAIIYFSIKKLNKNSFYVDNFRHDAFLEVIWTLLPTTIVVSILLPSLSLLYSSDEYVNPSVTVKVIGHQWYWSYEYTRSIDNLAPRPSSFDSVIKSPHLKLIAEPIVILPLHTVMRFLITSADVIHSWAIPSWGVKVDAIPGRLNQVITTVYDKGFYYGQCSELCGVGHGFMPISIEVVDVVVYLDWLLGDMSSLKKSFNDVIDSLNHTYVPASDESTTLRINRIESLLKKLRAERERDLTERRIRELRFCIEHAADINPYSLDHDSVNKECEKLMDIYHNKVGDMYDKKIQFFEGRLKEMKAWLDSLSPEEREQDNALGITIKFFDERLGNDPTNLLLHYIKLKNQIKCEDLNREIDYREFSLIKAYCEEHIEDIKKAPRYGVASIEDCYKMLEQFRKINKRMSDEEYLELRKRANMLRDVFLSQSLEQRAEMVSVFYKKALEDILKRVSDENQKQEVMYEVHKQAMFDFLRRIGDIDDDTDRAIKYLSKNQNLAKYLLKLWAKPD